MGVLTSGKHRLLRWPGASEVRLTRPYVFTLDGPEGWFPLYEWLRDSALVSLEDVKPDSEGIAGHFRPGSPSYRRDIAGLKTLHANNAALETIRVKRRLWHSPSFPPIRHSRFRGNLLRRCITGAADAWAHH